MIKKILTLLVCYIFSNPVSSQNIRFYDIQSFSSYQSALQKCILNDKMLFVVVYENGDDFYKMQKDDVFADPNLSSKYLATLPIAVDIYSDMGARLAANFEIKKLPSFFYFTTEEALVMNTNGYKTAEQLIKNLEEAQTNEITYKALKNKYSKGELNHSEWRQLIDFHSLNFDFDNTQKLAGIYFKELTNQELLEAANFKLVARFGLDLETIYPKLLLTNKDKFPSKGELLEYYQTVYSYNFDRAILNQDSTLIDKILLELIPNNPNANADISKLQFETSKVFASETKNFNIWRDAAFRRILSFENDSVAANFLFDEAYEIADEFNTSKAHKVSKEMCRKANVLSPKYNYYMLEAYMAYLLKEYDYASAMIEQAEKLTSNANNLKKASNLSKIIAKERLATEKK